MNTATMRIQDIHDLLTIYRAELDILRYSVSDSERSEIYDSVDLLLLELEALREQSR